MFLRLAILVSLIYCHTAFAESDENHPHQLADMIISVPLDQTLSETALPKSVLIGDKLRTKIEPTIGATLEQQPGISNASFGPGVGQPVIRGQSGSRVKVLQNSLGSLDVSNLSPDHANSTEPLWADRIEILRGPATLLYGSGAIGGIVNIIDNRIPDHVPDTLLQGALEQRYNTVNEGISSAFKLEGGIDRLAWHVDGFYRESIDMQIPGYAIDESAEADGHAEDGHEEEIDNSFGRLLNTNTRARGGSAGFSYVGDNGFIGVSVNHLDNNYGIPPGAHSHEEEHEEGEHEEDEHQEEAENVRIDMRQTRYDLKGEWYEPFEFAEQIKLRVGYNDYQHVELENGAIGTTYKNKGIVSRFELTHLPWLWFDHGVVGFQTDNSEFSALGEEAVVPKSDIDRFGFFTLQDIHTENVIYELGLRVEQQFITPDDQPGSSHTPVSFSTSALWNFSEKNNVSLSFSRSQRAPDVQELYADGPHLATSSYDIGDPNLDNETTYYLELGLHLDQGWVQADFNVYQNWVNDYIALINTGTFYDQHDEMFVNQCIEGGCLPVFQTEQQNAEFTGYEAQLNFPLWQSGYGDLSGQLFSDYVRGRFTDGGDIPRLPPLRYGMQLSWDDHVWHAALRLTRAEDQDHPGENETETEGYWLLNASADYRLKVDDRNHVLLFVKANNLLNEEIRYSTSFLRNIAPQGARGVEMGLRYVF